MSDAQKHPGRVVIVTGPPAGIGAATVRRFLSEGATVVAADIDVDGLAAFRAEFAEDASLGTHVTDVSSWESVQDLVESTVSEHGALDVLVNNAGTSSLQPVHRLPVEEWK